MADITQEVVDLLHMHSIPERLAEQVQSEREIERAELLARLADQQARDTEAAARLTPKIPGLEKRVIEAEAEAARARRELCEVRGELSHIGTSAEKLKGKLRRLADPRIDAGQNELRTLADKARNAGRVTVHMARLSPFDADRKPVEKSNYLEIGDVLASIRAAINELESFKDMARPADLGERINAMIERCRSDVRKVLGV